MDIMLASQVRESVVFHAMLFFGVPRMCSACAVHPSYMCHIYIYIYMRVRGCVLAMLMFPTYVVCELYGWYSIARCVRHSSKYMYRVRVSSMCMWHCYLTRTMLHVVCVHVKCILPECMCALCGSCMWVVYVVRNLPRIYRACDRTMSGIYHVLIWHGCAEIVLSGEYRARDVYLPCRQFVCIGLVYN